MTLLSAKCRIKFEVYTCVIYHATEQWQLPIKGVLITVLQLLGVGAPLITQLILSAALTCSVSTCDEEDALARGGGAVVGLQRARLQPQPKT